MHFTRTLAGARTASVVTDLSRSWMLRSQALFIDGLCLLVERLGVLVLALISVHICQIVESFRHLEMHLTLQLLSDAQGSLVERLRLLIFALFSIEICQSVQRRGSFD